MTDELKACPFCGEPAGTINDQYAVCNTDDCPIAFDWIATEVWNTRPLEDALLARAERAEAKCDEIASELAELESAKGDLFDEASTIRAERDRAEAMVERLIEVGDKFRNSEVLSPELFGVAYKWQILAAEWQARNE